MPEKVYVYIVFTTLNHWISRLICWFTRGKWSHVELFLPEHNNLIGAMPGKGVIIRKFSNIAKSIYRVSMVEVYSTEIQSAIIKKAKEQLGKPYDWAAIFGFVFRRDWQKQKKWFCSELVAYAFNKGGIPLLDGKASLVSPRDVDMSPIVKDMSKEEWEAWKLKYGINIDKN